MNKHVFGWIMLILAFLVAGIVDLRISLALILFGMGLEIKWGIF